LSGERVERRLAAIVAADVVGYSRLMGADDARDKNLAPTSSAGHAPAGAKGRR
jgi:hypothetical protein